MEYLSYWRILLTIVIAIYPDHQASAALSTCGGTLRGKTGTITSPNYPHSPTIPPEAAAVGTFPSNESKDKITCEWTIIAPEGFGILLNFGEFDMAAGLDACNKGQLELFSGIGKSRKSLDIYCGSDQLSKTSISSNSATIIFRRPVDFTGRGFLASYIATSPGQTVANFMSCADRGTDLVGTGSYSVMCPGGCGSISDMPVRGNSLYRDDSCLCKAAVHAGVITDTFGGMVEVKKLPGQLFYWGTEANGVVSEAGAMSDMKFQFDRRPDSGCDGQIQFQGNQLTASSYWTTDKEHQRTKWIPANAILEHQVDAWSPNDPTTEQWLQVDLKEPKIITGIMTRGSSDTYYTTKSFRIAYANDATSEWVFYREDDVDHDKVFLGNQNIFKNASNNFIRPRIFARFLRVYPTPVQTEKTRYSLQIALYGCIKILPDPTTSQFYAPRNVTALSETTSHTSVHTPGVLRVTKEIITSTKSTEKPSTPKTRLNPTTDDEGIGENSIIIIAIVAALSVTSILLAALVLFLVKKRKKVPKDIATFHQMQSRPIVENNNTGFQYKPKKSRKRSRKSTGEHFQNSDYKDTLLPSVVTPNAVAFGQTDQTHFLLNGSTQPSFGQNEMVPQKSVFQSPNEDSFSDEEDHEYQVIDDGQVATNIGRGSSKASTGSSLGNHSRKSDTMQRMWGVDGNQWQNQAYPPNSPIFPQMNGHPPMSSFSSNAPPKVAFFPKNSHLSRNNTFSHETRYSAGDTPSHSSNLRRGNSQSPSRMQRHSSSSNNSSHSYPPNGFQQPQGDHNGPYYSSVPGGDGNQVALNHAMYGRESIPEQTEIISAKRRSPSYKVPRSQDSELPALPDKNGASFPPNGSDPSLGSFGRTSIQRTRSDYDRLYRNSSSGPADNMNSFSISSGSHSQYDQLNLNGAHV